MDPKERKLLATLAAHGTLFSKGPYNVRELTRAELLEHSGLGEREIDVRLEHLVEAGYVSKRNTGYNGYGGCFVEGVNVWSITPKGLIFLWA